MSAAGLEVLAREGVAKSTSLAELDLCGKSACVCLSLCLGGWRCVFEHMGLRQCGRCVDVCRCGCGDM